MKIRILLVDDQNLVRQGLQALIKDNLKLELVGYAVNGKDAIEQVGMQQPDIVLIDIEMPQMNGIVATQKICQQFPQTKVIVLSSHEDVEYVIQSLKAGAKGYLLKETLFEDLEKSIELVHHGYSQISSKLLAKAIPQINFVQTKVPLSQLQTATPNCLEMPSQNSIHYSSAELKVRSLSNGNSIDYTKLNDNQAAESTDVSPPTTKPASATQSSSIPRLSSQISVSSNTSDTDISPKPKSEAKVTVSKSKFWFTAVLLALAGLILAVTSWRFFERPKSQSTSASKLVDTKPSEPETVVALGRIEPLGKVISLSAPTSLEAVQVEELLVKENDRLEAGQVVAILDGSQRLQAALDEAATKVKIAQARLERVQAGAKSSSISAKKAAIANLKAELAGERQTQQATIAKAQAQLDNARSELQRHQMLHQQGAISASELDSKKLAANTAESQLKETQAAFDRTQLTLEARIDEAIALLAEIQEIRPVDLQIAQAELNQAQAAASKARSDMELSYVRSPLAGVVLAVHTRPGEAPDGKGIVEIGKTEQMMVTAEVDQNDIRRIKIGQKATVVSGVFSEKLQGRVYQISSLIGKNDLLDTDPTADEDTRVVEVQIILEPEASQKVIKLTNLEVDVTIEV